MPAATRSPDFTKMSRDDALDLRPDLADDRRDLMTAMYSDVITTGLLASCWTPTPTGGILGGPAGPPLEQATRAEVTSKAADKLSRRA